MSFPDSKSPFVPPGLGSNTDAITINALPQYPVVNSQCYDHNTQFEQQPHSLKRPRDEENHSDIVSVNFMSQRMAPCSSVRVNTVGVNNIFYKTRVCAKFKFGLCRNGEMCKYAHGVEDLRQPPPNWQGLVNGRGDEDRGTGNWDDEQRIASKMKSCKNFLNGEVCPYGENCNFLHDVPKRFRDNSSAISAGASLNTASGHVSGLDQTDANRVNAGLDAYRMNVRTEHWKTKLCVKFESSGFCSFGDKCGFAHGIAELQGFVNRAEGDIRSVGALTTHIVGMPNYPVSSTMYTATSNEEQLVKRDFSKLKGSKKINRIYGDWIVDIPLDAQVP